MASRFVKKIRVAHLNTLEILGFILGLTLPLLLTMITLGLKFLKLNFSLERTSNEINSSFDGIRERHARLKFNMKNNTGHIRTMKEQSRSKFIRLKGEIS